MRKTFVYDGSWDIPKEPAGPPAPGQTREWPEPKKREPKFVTLAPGGEKTLELNLSKMFRSSFGAGKYHMTVEAEDGQKAVKEFEVYFDCEKSVEALGRMLASADEGERNGAVINLAQYSRPKLITLLEELVKTGSEKQREFAARTLQEIRAGRSGSNTSAPAR